MAADFPRRERAIFINHDYKDGLVEDYLLYF